MKRFVASLKNYAVDGMAIGVGFAIVAAVLVLFLMVSLVANAFIGAVAHAEEALVEPNLAEEAAILSEVTEPVTMTVTGDHVRMRAEPNTDCKVVGHKDRGDEVKVVGISDGWAELADGSFMSAEYLVESESQEAFEAMAREVPAEVQEYADKYSDIVVTVLSEQYTWYFRDHKLVAYGKVTTGRNGHKTPTGLYTVIGKHHNLYMDAEHKYLVEYAIFFNGNIAYHDADWQTSGFGSSKYRATGGSAGCVRCVPDGDLIKTLWQYTVEGKTNVAILP